MEHVPSRLNPADPLTRSSFPGPAGARRICSGAAAGPSRATAAAAVAEPGPVGAAGSGLGPAAAAGAPRVMFTPLVGARLRLAKGHVTVTPNLTQPERHLSAPALVAAYQRESPLDLSSGPSSRGWPPRWATKSIGTVTPSRPRRVGRPISGRPAGWDYIVCCGGAATCSTAAAKVRPTACAFPTGGVAVQLADTHPAGVPRHAPWWTIWQLQDGGSQALPPARLVRLLAGWTHSVDACVGSCEVCERAKTVAPAWAGTQACTIKRLFQTVSMYHYEMGARVVTKRPAQKIKVTAWAEMSNLTDQIGRICTC